MASAVKESPGQESEDITRGDAAGDAGESPADQREHRGSDEVYLVEEATLNLMPQHMKILLERVPRGFLTPENLLVTLLYLLMAECGFSHHTDTAPAVREAFGGFYNCSRARKLANSVPIEWLIQSGSFQERRFRLLNYDEDFTLITQRIADSLCATFTPRFHSGFSISLSISRYVPMINQQSVHRSFRNLQELSLKAKNKLIIPARDVFMQNHATVAPYPSLFSMPHIVFGQIFKLLPRNARRNLAESCQRLASIQAA